MIPQVMDACLHGKEQTTYGDKAYADKTRREQGKANDIEWRVLRNTRRGRCLNCADLSFSGKSNRVRARVSACAYCPTHADREHPFGVIKHLWGYRKVRYRGLVRNTWFVLANSHLVRWELATAKRQVRPDRAERGTNVGSGRTPASNNPHNLS